MSSVFWVIFELFINLLQGFFGAYIMIGCLKVRKYKRQKPLLYILCTLVLFAAITFSNYNAYFEGIAIYVFALILFLFALAFLSGSICQKLFFAIAYTNASAVGSIFSTNLISYITKIPIYEFLSKSTTLRIITVIISNAVMFLILFIIKKITDKSQLILKESEWLLLSFDLAISIIAYMFLYYAIYSSESIQARFFEALCAVAIIVINISIYYLLARYSNRYKIQMENTLLRQKDEYQSKAIIETKKQYEALQKSRHDFNNFVCIIRGLNQEDKRDEIEKYIDNYQKSTVKSVRIIITGNSFIDAIVNTKISEAIELGIDVTTYISADIPEQIEIDMCNLIGNMFDNAIRATSNSKDKTIRFTIKGDDEAKSLNVCLKNSVDAPVLSANPNLTTDKQYKKSHGLGTKIIKDIAAKYNGFAEFYDEDGSFCCNVIINL